MEQSDQHATQSGVVTIPNYEGWDRALVGFLKSVHSRLWSITVD